VAGFDALVAGNVRAPDLIAAFAPGMAARGRGSIVNISSMVGQVGLRGAAAYGGTKAMLASMTRHWAVEYGTAGVRVPTWSVLISDSAIADRARRINPTPDPRRPKPRLRLPARRLRQPRLFAEVFPYQRLSRWLLNGRVGYCAGRSTRNIIEWHPQLGLRSSVIRAIIVSQLGLGLGADPMRGRHV
jgi:NAD(P)-dependent dehydrogenase (short-subunit alcohol dehydrogenase family)